MDYFFGLVCEFFVVILAAGVAALGVAALVAVVCTLVGVPAYLAFVVLRALPRAIYWTMAGFYGLLFGLLFAVGRGVRDHLFVITGLLGVGAAVFGAYASTL